MKKTIKVKLTLPNEHIIILQGMSDKNKLTLDVTCSTLIARIIEDNKETLKKELNL